MLQSEDFFIIIFTAPSSLTLAASKGTLSQSHMHAYIHTLTRSQSMEAAAACS